MTRLILISNRHARIPTLRSEIVFHSNVSIALVIPRYPCPNDNTSSAASIRCSVTSTGITGLYLARTARFPTTNVRNLRLKVSCTSRITRRGSMESICLRNARRKSSLFCSTYRYTNPRAQEKFFRKSPVGGPTWISYTNIFPSGITDRIMYSLDACATGIAVKHGIRSGGGALTVCMHGPERGRVTRPALYPSPASLDSRIVKDRSAKWYDD